MSIPVPSATTPSSPATIWSACCPRAKDEDDEPFREKMRRLTAILREQMAEAHRLEEAIWKNLKELGYDR